MIDHWLPRNKSSKKHSIFHGHFLFICWDIVCTPTNEENGNVMKGEWVGRLVSCLRNWFPTIEVFVMDGGLETSFIKTTYDISLDSQISLLPLGFSLLGPPAMKATRCPRRVNQRSRNHWESMRGSSGDFVGDSETVSEEGFSLQAKVLQKPSSHVS